MVNFNRPEHRSYLEAIARKHGGLEGLIATLAVDTDTVEGVRAMGATDPATVAASEEAIDALGLALQRKPLDARANLALEAIIDDVYRPPYYIKKGSFQIVGAYWHHLNSPGYKKALENVIPGVGRIELPGSDRYPYLGTGFRVGKTLMMTNRHVAALFCAGVGTKALRFNSTFKPEVDMLEEHEREDESCFSVVNVRMVHPYWDMAILEVDRFPDNIPILKLSTRAEQAKEGTEVAVVGYPAYDVRNPDDVQRRLFEGVFGVKRLQPGFLANYVRVASFGKEVEALGHDCSTLGGNSGSAIFDTSSGSVLGLHFGGLYRSINYAVPAHALASDSRVMDLGVETDAVPGKSEVSWQAWWKRADKTSTRDAEAMATDVQVVATSGPPGQTGPTAHSSVSGTSSSIDVSIKLDLQASPQVVSVNITIPRPDAQVHDATAALEGMKEPHHDERYEERTGYTERFLDPDETDKTLVVPMPKPVNSKVLALNRQGTRLLHYQNFSVAMHAKRRLAMFTASNVTREADLRMPDPAQKYTRGALGGLGENDTERWFSEPRLDPEYQLPDYFFTYDRKSFDKGHLVRREDVAWGETYELLRRANGDTYHVTNCSPQVKGFNQSAHGKENWGDLENVVFSAAKTERLCVLAGPIFAQSDQTFKGLTASKDEVHVQIPSQYWKVVVCRLQEGLGAFGFVLTQDLNGVSWEMAVPPEFVPHMKSLEYIEQRTGLRFDRRLKAVDQVNSLLGEEIAWYAGAAAT